MADLLGPDPSPLRVLAAIEIEAGFRAATEQLRRTMARVGREMDAFIRHARLAAGGTLLLARLGVDVDAARVPAGEWTSPACTGWLCSSCPGLECHHRCHGGPLR